MREGRGPDEPRPIRLKTGHNRWAEGSAWVEWGHTHVQATVTVDKRLPPHLRGHAHAGGWLTAEYALLPRATHERRQRERLYAGGRSVEIQRLLGRALRSVVDLTLFRKQTLIVDIDVLQADGGTRCAGILAGYAALHHACDGLVRAGRLTEWPLRCELGAISVGVVDGEARTDLDFEEDVAAEVDLNVVATADGRLVEVQGGTETEPVAAEAYVALVGRGVTGVQTVLHQVRSAWA